MPAPRPRRPTLVDVAKAAGVSLGSASRVMHHPDSVRERTRSAVQQAAVALGYVPDGRARALASGRSLMVAVVLPTINNPVYAEFAHILQRKLATSGYSLVVQAHVYDAGAEVAQIAGLVGRGVDGIILVGTDRDPAVDNILAGSEMPHVFAWSAEEDGASDCIGFSNRGAMRQMAEHLLDLGHRRLAVISRPLQDNERARGRLAGIREALPAANADHAFVVHHPFSVAGGRAGLVDILEHASDRTAILCTTDLTAIGALAEARARSIDVPADLTITGFDDIDVAAATCPPLTTIRAPIAEMGDAVADAIVVRMSKPEPGPSLTIMTELVVRGSAAPPRTG